ncbi:vitamin K epoxide reductase family protein [Nocardioides sp. Iso805N]|uniref:vitamin K epoxide reductase family protein n=1 Tax=Nocardioides sp. Iso805N TaxID=1283287 RepID=UPI000365FA18|nr:vitamin K epoxide reductase family protein [Nocardioides sp. Iso805N]
MQNHADSHVDPPVEPDADADEETWRAYLLATDDYERRHAGEGRVLRWWLLVAGLVGLYAAASLVLDKLSYFEQLAAGHNPTLSCNLNPIVGCGHVINTPQASIFWNLPNPVIGVAAWPVVAALGVLLISDVRLRAWHWIALEVGVVGGIVMVSWLQFQTIFHINALCPWCMVTWAVMIPTFWAVTARNLRSWAYDNAVAKLVYEVTPVWIVLHFLVLIGIIYAHFGSRLWA